MSEFNGVIRRAIGIVAIGLTVLAMMPTSAFAADNACDGVKVEVTKERKQEYAPLVAAALDNKFKPARAKFGVPPMAPMMPPMKSVAKAVMTAPNAAPS